MTPQSPDQTQEDLSFLIGAGASQPVLAAHLDPLDPQRRIDEVRRLSARGQAALYERCADAPPLSLSDFVPANVSPGKTMVFAGKNSLPVFSFFEKRFTRLPSGAVVGFNYQLMSFATGPGYFTLAEGPELLFDYTRVPPADAVPAGWPAVKTNQGGISRFVFQDLHDFCRRVSSDVVIGHATRLGKPLPQYFVLARRGMI